MPNPIDAKLRRDVVESYLTRKKVDSSTTYALVAAEYGVGEASVSRWLRRHREDGTVEARKQRRGGTHRKLTGAQGDDVAAWVIANPSKRLWEVQEYVEHELGVKVSEGTVRRTLGERNIGKRRLARLTPIGEAPASADTNRRYGEEHRRTPQDKPHRHAYPSDLTDLEWAALEPLWRQHAQAFPEKHNLRDVVDALRYIGATGCPWRYLPNDFPPHETVRKWFDLWHRDGTVERVNDALRRSLRRLAGRQDTPSVLIIDSLSIKSHEGGKDRGYDGGKKISGRKRHITNSIPHATQLLSTSTVRARAPRKKPLRVDHASSIGFRSGEYGGKNTNFAPCRASRVGIRGSRWAPALSRTTRSPGFSVGARTFSTKVANTLPSVPPSMVIIASRPPRSVSAPTIVVTVPRFRGT